MTRWKRLFVCLSLILLLGVVSVGRRSEARADTASVASDVLGQTTAAGGPAFGQGGGQAPSASPSQSQSFLEYNAVVDSTNHRLFVSDDWYSRVLVYDLDSSNHLTSEFANHVLGQADFSGANRYCSSSTTQNHFCNPGGMAYDASNDRLFVADSNNRVLVFNLSGGLTNGMSPSYVLGQANFTSHSCGSAAASLCNPHYVSYDSAHQRLFVSDSNNNRVVEYDLSSGVSSGMSAAHVLGQSGFSASTCDAGGESASTLCAPAQLAYDSGGDRLFVADPGTGTSTLENSRVLEYSLSSGISNGMAASHVLGQTGFTSHGCNSGGRSAQTLCDPSGVAYDSGSSTLFVSDPDGGNQRVLSYDLSGGVSNGMSASHVLGQPNLTAGTSPACTAGGDIGHTTFCSPGALTYDSASSQLLVDDQLSVFFAIFDLSGGISNGMASSSALGGPTATSMSYPQGSLIDPLQHRLFVANCGGGYGRVLEFDLNDNNNLLDRQADHVLGQADFTTNSVAATQSTLGECIVGLAYDSGNDRLFVTDENNNRVLVYDLSSGISDGMNASYVLGQPDFTSGASGSTCWWFGGSAASSNLCSPYGGLAYDPSTQYLYVGDEGNSRVLVYDLSSGITNGMAASYVLGQPNFTSHSEATTQSGFSGAPISMALDSAHHRLFVGDWGSAARVLVWDTSSLSNGMNAAHVLGEADFISANSAADIGDPPDANSFIPEGLTYDPSRERLFVADSDSNGSNPVYRILVFDVTAISNDENAVGVLGQPDFTSTNTGRNCTPSQHTLCDPEGTDDYYDPAHDRLYVSDSGDQRLLTFTVPSFTGPSYGKAPASWTQGLSNPSVPGLCSCLQDSGDPVDTATGDFSETATDASAATFGPLLMFSRTYDASLAQAQAATSTPGPLGYGWTDNWDASLSLNDPVSGAITVHQSNGADVSFYPPVSGACASPYVGSGASGTYCALPDVTASLSYDSGASKYTFVTHPYASYTFNGSGALIGEATPGGATLTVTHNSPAPGSGSCPGTAASCNTITSASGRALVIAENSANEVTQVTDPLGHSWTYSYCSPPSSTCSADDLISVTDPLNDVTSYTYDEPNANSTLVHDLLTITSPNGQPGKPNAGAKTVNTYNTAGQVNSQTDPDGNETTFDYSELDTSTGDGATVVTDPDGNETQFTYVAGVLTSKTEGYETDSPTTWIYEPNSMTLLGDEVIDPNGNKTSYTYDSKGNRTSVTNPLGNTWTYTYNDFDEKTCATQPLAASGCSSLSPPAAITAGASTVTPPSSAPPKYATYSEYDTDGSLIWTTTGEYNPGSSSASQSRTTYQLYDGQSVTLGANTDSCAASPPSTFLPCLTIDANAVVTQLGYDGSTGDLLSSSTPDGNSGGEVASTTYTYDGSGNLHTVVAPDGNLSGATAADFTTTYGYDDDGELTSLTISHTAGSITARTTTYAYDGDGNQIAVTNPRNKETDYTYDANDQQTLVTDPDNQKTLTCYDGDGHTAETVPPVGVAANSLSPSSCPAGYPSGYGDRLADDAITYAYDARGNTTTVTSPAPAGLSGNETTTNTYDDAGQLAKTTAPATSNSGGAANQVTTYTYDSAGDLLTTTKKGSDGSAVSTTSYCYDPNGEKTATVAPNGNSSTITSCSGSSPYQTSSANQTGYSYDSLGELVSKTRPATTWASSGQTTSYTYDPAGNPLTHEDANGVTTTNTFTPLNKLASVTYAGSSAPSASYGYDANGNRVSTTDGTGTSSYVYDPFNELTSYQNGSGKTVGYDYNDDGQVSSITYPLGSGATWASTDSVTYGYDDAGELTTVTDFNSHTITIGNTADGLPNSVALASSGDTINTSYDQTDTPSQITLTNGSSLLQFAYSDVPSGAIETETDTPSWSGSPAGYSYDAQNRVTQMSPGSGSPLTYGFDASGDLTTLPTGATGTYDNAAELTSSALSGATTSYTYDADGERMQATVGGTTTVSAGYNGAQQLTAYSNSAAGMSSATYDADGLRATATTTPTGGSASTQDFTWDPTGADPHLLMDSSNAYVYGPSNTPIEQANISSGTIRYLMPDVLGSVRGVVSSAGALTASTGYDAWGNPTSSGVTSYTPFGYVGSYTDPTGLSYLVNRYYDPTTAQFLTVDPLVDQTGAPYGYASGDPVNAVDPLGLGCFLGIACGAQSALSGAAGSTWAAVNPFSTSNLIRTNPLAATIVKYADPAYWAVSGYAQEARAYENGCSIWTQAKYGAEGTLGLASLAFIAGGGVVTEDAGGLLARLADETGSLRLGRAPEFYGGQLTQDQALSAAERWLGTGYRELSPGRFVSANGTRIVRYGSHETRGAVQHIHFEAAEHGWVVENTTVDIVP